MSLIPGGKSLLALCMCLTAAAAIASAQENPLSAFNKMAYGQMKVWLLASAEKVPQESYAFKPTDTVRSFGQILGHVADAQYLFCAPVLGEKSPASAVEKTKTSKADLIAALKEAFAYCDKAYDTATDAAGMDKVKMFRNELAKTSVLQVNITHTAEHYGNLVTYMRIKNIVPPSSEPAPAPPQKK